MTHSSSHKQEVEVMSNEKTRRLRATQSGLLLLGSVTALCDHQCVNREYDFTTSASAKLAFAFFIAARNNRVIETVATARHIYAACVN